MIDFMFSQLLKCWMGLSDKETVFYLYNNK